MSQQQLLGSTVKRLVVYVHGFRSSPLSAKSCALAVALQPHPSVTFISPQLPPSPRQAIELLESVLAETSAAEDVCFVGSSLGGFYSTVMVERHARCRALLLNPAIHPSKDLQAHVGKQSMWHTPEMEYDFTQNYITELKDMETELQSRSLSLSKYVGIFCTGDEVISWLDMCGRFGRGNNIRVVEGSDHGISDFHDHLEFALAFLLETGRPFNDGLKDDLDRR